MAALEDAVQQKVLEMGREAEEMRDQVSDLFSLVADLKAAAVAAGAGGRDVAVAGDGEGSGPGGVSPDAMMREVEALRAEMATLQAQMAQAQQAAAGGQELLQGVDVAGTAATVAALEAKLEAWQAQAQQQQGAEEGGEACRESVGELRARVEELAALTADKTGEDAKVLAAAAELRALLEPGQAQVLVEEARGIKAAVEGEVGAMKEQLLALSASAGGGGAGAGDGGVDPGASVDLGPVRAAVAEAVAAARSQLEVKEAVEQQLGEAEAVLARLQEASAAAAAAAEERGDGGREEEDEEREGRLEELEEELVHVREEAEALQQLLQEQEARVTAAVEGIQAAFARQQDEQAAVAAGAAQQPPALDQEAVEALVAAEVAKHLSALSSETEARAGAGGVAAPGAAGAVVDEEGVKALVQEAVQRQHRAQVEEETGWDSTDYAAAAGGGQVLTRLCSETYTPPGQILRSDWYERLGYRSAVPPRGVVLSGGALGRKRQGDCWPMAGRSGRFTVLLPHAVVPRAVALEHVAKAITRSPNSAPRRFAVFGRVSATDADPVKLHREDFLTYDVNKAAAPGAGVIQRFELDYAGPPLRVVTLEVVDNWGHPDFTCLYRFRVLADKEEVAVVQAQEQ